MFRIVDRRFDSKKKSTVNRERFFRRFRSQIRKAVSDAISGRSVTDIDNGESISIPARDLSEPQFSQDHRGAWENGVPYAAKVLLHLGGAAHDFSYYFRLHAACCPGTANNPCSDDNAHHDSLSHANINNNSNTYDYGD